MPLRKKQGQKGIVFLNTPASADVCWTPGTDILCSSELFDVSLQG